MENNFLIIITGPSSAGKSTLSHSYKAHHPDMQIISIDDYYYDRRNDTYEKMLHTNLDTPEAFDLTQLIAHLQMYKDHKEFMANSYNHKTRISQHNQNTISPHKPLILEGIMAAHCQDIRDLANTIIYIDTPLDLALVRQLNRQRSRAKVKDSLNKYLRFIRPGQIAYTEPTKKLAHCILKGVDAHHDLQALRKHLQDLGFSSCNRT